MEVVQVQHLHLPYWIITILLLISITTTPLTKCQSAYPVIRRAGGLRHHQDAQKNQNQNPASQRNRFYYHKVELPDVISTQTSPTTTTTPPPEQRRPRPAVVVVKCHKDSLEVLVQADLFHAGLPVDGRQLHLGSGSGSGSTACRAAPAGEAEFTIKALLTDCGTKLSATNEKLIYWNVLVYTPEPNIDGVLRLDAATIPIECHYDTKYAVDSAALRPTWAPFASKLAAEDHIDFNLRVMTADWQFERGSLVYFLGNPIHLEVSVIMNKHQPLRVFVDHCVATTTPDVDAALRYDFIENHGCLTDSSLTSSGSRFLPRVEDHRLRFQLDAFKFHRQSTNLIYISCHVKAVPALQTVRSKNRACSFTDNRWYSADGNDEACRCCDISSCSVETMPTEAPTELPTTTVAPTTTFCPRLPPPPPPPLLVWNRRKKDPASYFRIRPGMHNNQENMALSSSPSSGTMKREAGSRTDTHNILEWTKTTRLGPITIMPS